MKHVFVTLTMIICLVVMVFSQPVNPSANLVTRNVYDYLWGLSYGSTPGVIVGQNAGHGADYLGSTGSYNSEIVSIFNQTGKYPGMLGVDYEYTAINSLATLQSVNTSLAAYWNAGGLITINYSPRNILNNNGGPMTRNGAGQMNKILAGGSLRTAWLARLDVIAAALQDLQNKGVTVLWRPMQECNGPLFWYATSGSGKPAGQSAADYIAVWQDMYNYFTNTKGLNNLLWVFAPTGDPTVWIPPYPGNTFVDIVAPTLYSDPVSAYQEDANTYGKIIGMSELGPTGNSKVDDMQFLTATATNNPQFAYFVAWHDNWGISYNNNASTMMNDSRSITRDKIPDLGTSSTVAVSSVSVSPTTASVNVGAAVALTATVAPSNATNKNVTWTSSQTAIATVSAAGVVTGVAAGSATITVTTTDGAKTATVDITVTATAGTLTGTATQTTATVTLSTVGTTGWKHFRNNVYKSGSSNSISNYTVAGGTATAYSDDLRGMSWTGGTPTASSTKNKNGWYINGNTKGFSFTAPAGTTNNTLYVYVGGYNSAGRLTAQLSNAAAPNYVYASSTISGSYDFTFAITYNAGAAGKTISIKWEQIADGGSGNVTLQAAALNGAAARPANPSSVKKSSSAESFSIYPNPLNGSELHLNLNEISGKDDLLISMFDLSGKLIKSQLFKAGFYEKSNMKFQLNGSSAGVYIVSIQSGDKFFRRAIIKK